MEPPFRLEANPFASIYCRADFVAIGPKQFHTCHDDPGVSHTTNPFVGDPARPESFAGPQDYDATLATPRWGFGMILLPYLLDWGDCVKRIDRQRAEVTILRAFPNSADRRLALRTLDRWTWVGDDETTPMEQWLIQHQEHVGFKWIPTALKQWYDFATAGDLAALPPEGIGAEAAVTASNAWVAAVRPLWEELTSEPFPYDTMSMAGFWEPTLIGDPLPDLA